MRLDNLVERNQQRIAHAFHGTSTVFLDQIMKHGLNPNTEIKSYSIDASDYEEKSMASMGGIYLTNAYGTAQNYARRSTEKFGGKPMIVTIQYTTNSERVDEDDIYTWINNQIVKNPNSTSWRDSNRTNDEIKNIFHQIDNGELKNVLIEKYKTEFRISQQVSLDALWEIFKILPDYLEPNDFSAGGNMAWLKRLYRISPDAWRTLRGYMKELLQITGRPSKPVNGHETFRLTRPIGFKGKTKIISIGDGSPFKKWTSYGESPEKYIKEDTDSDLEQSINLQDLTYKIIRTFRAQLNDPTWNPDNYTTTHQGNRVIAFRGIHFGFPDILKNLWIILRPSGSKPLASFNSGKHRDDGHTVYIISFAVLPKIDDITDQMHQGMKRIVEYPMWHGAIVHELQHVFQSLHNIPFNSSMKGKNNQNPIDTTTNYYNEPTEFDAFYHQRTRYYHMALASLKAGDTEAGVELLKSLRFDDDFKTAIENMLPKNFDDDEFGIWFYGKDKQRRRLIKRLYTLHKAIVEALHKQSIVIKENNMEDDHTRHAAALAATGYWGNAGAGCLIVAKDTGRILLPLRSEWVEQPGTWGTWGGAIDRGENPQTAAMREVSEEAGYPGKVLQMVHLYRFQDKSFRYDTFAAVVETEFEPTLNWETSQAEWVEFGKWPKPLHFGLEAVLKDSTAMNKLGNLTSS